VNTLNTTNWLLVVADVLLGLNLFWRGRP